MACVLYVSLLLHNAHGAGWCTGIERGASCGTQHANSVEAQSLHLLPGEKPRDSVWGAGMITTTLHADVVVAGGGSAGTSAAIAAARSGASVVLVNGRPVLGGNSGSEVRLSMVGACGPRAGGSPWTHALKLECREGGIVEEYQLDNAVNNPNLVPELFSLELLTLIKAEPRITLFQNTWLVGVNTSSSSSSSDTDGEESARRTIDAAILEDQGSQRRYVVHAKAFIDATGDGRLGAEAGAEWIQGREGYAKYNESLAKLGFYRDADDGPDHETEGTSLAYMAEAKPTRSSYRAPFWAAKYNASQFQYRGVAGDRPYGYWWNEISYPYNTITDGENVTQEALSDILGIWDYLKNSGDHPEADRMGLTWIGNVGCKREGRRFIGQYVMNQNDVMSYDYLCTRKPPWCPPKNASRPRPKIAQEPTLFWDRIAFAGWPFDLHNPKGMRDPSHPPFTSHKMPYMYSTPLRSLVSKDLTNLFFAGRLASFSHVVYGSQRVMKTCATMGQAAGTAAAYSILHDVAPFDLSANREAVWSIQQQLLRDDAYIIGALNEDPRDLARRPGTHITATSERVPLPNASTANTSSSAWWDGAAMNVVSGQTRSVTTSGEGESMGSGGGVPFSQGLNGTNRWISVGLPASIVLTLATPAAVKQASLIFDSGMHRTLSYSVVFKTNNPASVWAAQPETAKDYIIEGRDAGTGKWLMLCNVSGNYQRRRVHTLPCPTQPTPPTPPPSPPIIAPGSVVATTCNVSAAAQRWSIAPAVANATLVTIRSADGALCLGFDPTTSAYGGHGNSVVARSCGGGVQATPPSWQWHEAIGGALLRTGAAHPSCSGGEAGTACECAQPVACAACHGTEKYLPPASVELWSCDEGTSSPDVSAWSSLSVNDGGGGHGVGKKEKEGAVLLMVGGLCLEAPVNQRATYAAPPAPPQRVQAKSAADVAAEAAPAPIVSAVRLTVSATNGVPDARVNEIRLYDADGVAPFPSR